LSRREAARTAILFAFDLIEHDGEDLSNLPFLERKAALARLLRRAKAGILLNECIAEDGATVFAHACQLGPRASCPRGWTVTYRSGPCRAWIKVRNLASIAVQRERREKWNQRFLERRRRPAAKAKSSAATSLDFVPRLLLAWSAGQG
jgi:ATP-dependent DNA ligase